MVVLFIWEVLKIPRIIVKTGYIKGKAHKEYYVQYIAQEKVWKNTKVIMEISQQLQNKNN